MFVDACVFINTRIVIPTSFSFLTSKEFLASRKDKMKDNTNTVSFLTNKSDDAQAMWVLSIMKYTRGESKLALAAIH